MSRYDWEQGTIKVPTAAWKAVRDTLTKEHNRLQDHAHALAVEVHQKLLAIKKVGGRKALQRPVRETLSRDPFGQALVRRLEQSELRGKIERAVQKVDASTGSVELTAPKKKDFGHAVSTKATSYTVGEGDGVIEVDHQTHELRWVVYENNHAVDRARASWMGKVFFRALSTVKWTRQTGGVISSNDEYHSENKAEGGGANYASARFGPLGEKTDPFALLKKRRGQAGYSGVALAR